MEITLGGLLTRGSWSLGLHMKLGLVRTWGPYPIYSGLKKKIVTAIASSHLIAVRLGLGSRPFVLWAGRPFLLRASSLSGNKFPGSRAKQYINL